MGDSLLVMIDLFSLGAFVLSQFMRLTDRRTDGWTDGQMLIGKTALHTMQRGKNPDIVPSNNKVQGNLPVNILCRKLINSEL